MPRPGPHTRVFVTDDFSDNDEDQLEDLGFSPLPDEAQRSGAPAVSTGARSVVRTDRTQASADEMATHSSGQQGNSTLCALRDCTAMTIASASGGLEFNSKSEHACVLCPIGTEVPSCACQDCSEGACACSHGAHHSRVRRGLLRPGEGGGGGGGGSQALPRPRGAPAPAAAQ